MSPRAAPALLAAALLSLALASPAAALTAEEMYEADTVVVVDLQLPPESVKLRLASPGQEQSSQTRVWSSRFEPTG